MKVAIVHELLTRRGGAERIAKIFSEMFPQAPIYTLLYDEQRLGDWFPRHRVITSSLQPNFQLSIIDYQFNHHRYLNKFPKAVESFNFDEFDLVLSSSSAFAHGIITNGSPKHICYVHSPARYLWDATHNVIERANRGPLGFLKKWYLQRTFHKLRIWDAEVAPRPDVLLANSKEVQRRIELYWRRESEVVTPPIEDFWFDDSVIENREPVTESFVIVSTLTRYKNINIAIQACNTLKLPLTIIGEGPDRKRLEKLAGPTITFQGYQSNEAVRDAYTKASAVLFTSNDDFGLVPLEANACGTPVIALQAGGALETVTPKTGMFFEQPTTESLISTLQQFDASRFSANDCQVHAKQFNRKQLEENINLVIENTINL